MKSFIAIAVFAAGANALVGRSNSCCFELTASGGASGTLGQLTDGQVRVGDTTLSASEFCLSGSIITDSEGRGCVITCKYTSTNDSQCLILIKNLAETTQFQCDQGSSGTSGFSLTSSGLLEFDGSSSFIACQTGEDNGSNIYTTDSDAVTNCVSVELTSDSTCAVSSSSSVIPAATPAPSSSTPVPVAVSPVASSAPAPEETTTTSRPLIPTSTAQSVTPVPVSSTPVAKVTTASSTSTSTSTSTTSTASTVGSSTGAAASGAASTAPAASSATAPALGFAHWVAALTVMVGMMVIS
ncbi:uncharacterized protein N7483_004113 [Penicillium malachiteum]|uniref:uncharacterized protein n=1 Tax=Penicillium malachiteum TaxID=1324776 RepID=UPI0025491680|nr:uncharacterized protein N7483_004113 [Penicillium malachiteum]KAJ5729605.1 hypothetical protein N7483_004113 [Penicillium malachiteum]